MHDPYSQIFNYGPLTLWHVDPEKDGSDDSCGWFMRARHGSKEALEKVIQMYSSDWDSAFTSEKSGKTYATGYFYPDGSPRMSTIAIINNLVFWAVYVHYGYHWKKRGKTSRFMRKHFYDIVMFAENTTDSMYDKVMQTFGKERSREERIREFAEIIYAWVLRQDRPWWKAPRYHFWHWKINFRWRWFLPRHGYPQASMVKEVSS